MLAAQAAQDKHYSQCAEDKVEQLMVDLIAEQEKLMTEQERLMAEQDRCKQLQEELDARNAEIDQMAKKLVNRNAELKLYKVLFFFLPLLLSLSYACISQKWSTF
jgi:hypothetical protein